MSSASGCPSVSIPSVSESLQFYYSIVLCSTNILPYRQPFGIMTDGTLPSVSLLFITDILSLSTSICKSDQINLWIIGKSCKLYLKAWLYYYTSESKVCVLCARWVSLYCLWGCINGQRFCQVLSHPWKVS